MTHSRLLMFFALCSAALAQTSGSNVRMVQFLAPTTVPASGGTVTLTSTTLANIGQTNHSARLLVSDLDGTSFGGQLVMDGSDDGVNWFTIGPTLTFGDVTNHVEVFTATGYGAYPYLRVDGFFNRASGGAAATITGYYSGTSAPSSVLTDVLAASPVNVTASGSGAGSTVLVAGSVSATLSPTVYGIVFSAPATITSLALTCVSLGSANTLLVNPLNLPQPFVLPVGMRPYFQCLPGKALSLVTTGTGAWNVTLYYRTE